MKLQYQFSHCAVIVFMYIYHCCLIRYEIKFITINLYIATIEVCDNNVIECTQTADYNIANNFCKYSSSKKKDNARCVL